MRACGLRRRARPVLPAAQRHICHQQPSQTAAPPHSPRRAPPTHSPHSLDAQALVLDGSFLLYKSATICNMLVVGDPFELVRPAESRGCRGLHLVVVGGEGGWGLCTLARSLPPRTRPRLTPPALYAACSLTRLWPGPRALTTRHCCASTMTSWCRCERAVRCSGGARILM